VAYIASYCIELDHIFINALFSTRIIITLILREYLEIVVAYKAYHSFSPFFGSEELSNYSNAKLKLKKNFVFVI